MGATSFERELKRGSAELLILALLEEHAASLYPTLYRMEDNGLIHGRWVEKTGQRRRRYYRLTAAGKRTLARQRGLWAQFVAGLENITRSLPA